VTPPWGCSFQMSELTYDNLSKSKSYLKIIGLPHNTENGVLTLEVVKDVLKDSYLFKNVVLASKP